MASQPAPTGHVFISYAREDQAYARKLADSLRQRGFEVWMDDRIDPAQRWWSTIVQALRDCAAFVVVMTPDSEESIWVSKEIHLALEERKPFFPLLLRGQRFPICVDLQCADVTGGRLPPDEFYERLEREVRAQPEEEIIAPVVPERTVRKERVWSWQRLRLPLEVVGLLAIVLLIGVVASGLIGGGEEPTPIPTASVSVVAAQPTPTHTARPATATSTSAPVVDDTPIPQPPTPVPGLDVGSTKLREKDGMEMVYVPGGTFEMGSTDAEIDAAFEQCEQDRGSGGCERSWSENQSPRHSVTLDGFWIDQTAVTNSQYARCVADGTCSPPSDSSSSTRDSYYGDSRFDDYPVIYVSWYDADTYCQWVGGRLPTEAEWEYAARGPDGGVYPWGNSEHNSTLANYDRNVGDTTEVGSYPDGESWVGALDMAGNVWEWVNDWYADDYYAVSPAENPTGPDTGDGKVLRGGSWRFYADLMRSADRSGGDLGIRSGDFGFRCVVASASSP